MLLGGCLLQYFIAVAEERRGVLSHPVMQAHTTIKWKFIYPLFFCHFISYIVFLLLWSVLIMFPTVQEQHIYKLPQDLWRIICSVSLFMIFFVVSMRNYLRI